MWAGVDQLTVQSWLGHSDLVSAMGYLKPSRDKKVHEKVNETFAQKACAIIGFAPALNRSAVEW